jgi:tetratricopeptide (TPR) repeat protein
MPEAGPQEKVAPSLPDLGEAASPLTDRDKKFDVAQACKEATDELANHEDQVRHVIALLRFHWPSNPESAEINILLAQAHARVLEGLELKNKADREPHRRHREAGKFHVEAALRAKPGSADAHYWHGAILLHTAEAESSYGRMKEGLTEMEAAAKLDPRVDSGGPDRMIGRIYQEAPGWPIGLGSRSKAIGFYKKSLEIAPESRLTHLWIAETYSADGQTDNARTEAAKAAEGKPRPGHEKEDKENIQKAQELLKKLDAK